MSTILIEENVNIINFRDDKTQQLMQLFNLKRLEESNVLNSWLSTPMAISGEERNFFERFEYAGEARNAFLNEGEFKLHLTYPLLQRVDFSVPPQYETFAGRTLEVLLEQKGILFTGQSTLLVSSGRYEPVEPYHFFFQSYKSKLERTDDLVAQLLSGMLTGQALNNNAMPVYGACALNGMWFFVTLEGRNYCISNAYVSSRQDDLEQVFMILTAMKGIIEARLNIN